MIGSTSTRIAIASTTSRTHPCSTDAPHSHDFNSNITSQLQAFDVERFRGSGADDANKTSTGTSSRSTTGENGNAHQKSASGTYRLKPIANWFHIACMVFLFPTGGWLAGWTGIVANGAGFAILSLTLVMIAYIALFYSLAELTSAIPFSGGSYGFARATLNHWAAVLVGLCECAEYILTLVMYVTTFASSITTLAGTDPELEILWYFLFLVITLIPQFLGGKWFWNLIVTGASFSLLMFIILCCAVWAAPGTSFSTYAKLDLAANNSDLQTWFTGGAAGFFSVLPAGMWFPVGMELIPLAAEDTLQPRTAIPKGMMIGMFASTVVFIVILITSISLPAGMSYMYSSSYPFAAIASYLWPVDPNETNPFVANWTVFLFVTLGYAFCTQPLMFACGRQIFALSRAGHFPPWFAATLSNGVPYRALSLSAATTFAFAIIARISLDYNATIATYFNTLIFFALLQYTFDLSAYVRLKLFFHEIPRQYTSPFGIYGAAVAGGIFALCFISILVYTPVIQNALIAAGVYVAAGVAYYGIWGRRSTILSPEDKFALYVRITAERMLTSGLGYSYLHSFCVAEHSAENVEAWQAVQNLLSKSIDGSSQAAEGNLLEKLKASAKVKYQVRFNADNQVESLQYKSFVGSSTNNHAAIRLLIPVAEFVAEYVQLYTTYWNPVSTTAVNLPSFLLTRAESIKQKLESSSHHHKLDSSLVQSCLEALVLIQQEICRLLDGDTLARFKRSSDCIRYLSKEPLLFLKENRDQVEAAGVGLKSTAIQLASKNDKKETTNSSKHSSKSSGGGMQAGVIMPQQSSGKGTGSGGETAEHSNKLAPHGSPPIFVTRGSRTTASRQSQPAQESHVGLISPFTVQNIGTTTSGTTAVAWTEVLSVPIGAVSHADETVMIDQQYKTVAHSHNLHSHSPLPFPNSSGERLEQSSNDLVSSHNSSRNILLDQSRTTDGDSDQDEPHVISYPDARIKPSSRAR